MKRMLEVEVEEDVALANSELIFNAIDNNFASLVRMITRITLGDEPREHLDELEELWTDKYEFAPYYSVITNVIHPHSFVVEVEYPSTIILYRFK